MVSQRSTRASRRAGSVSTNGANDVSMEEVTGDVHSRSSEEGVEANRRDDDQHATPSHPGTSYAPRSGEDHVKIMLATDNHIGYMERDPVRGQDSINTFREILQLAVEHDVDFILLGGDLFHENKPSRTTLHQVMGLLREYTLGDKPVSIELLSDPSDGAPEGYTFPAVNYEDQNLNVAIPVFSIHGNHDDPQGVGVEGALSALDLLSVTGLVNYFGKVELPSSDALASRSATTAPAAGGLSDDGIRIRPVLLQKGDTKIALYGMGNIKDERMHYELRANRVRMYRPREDPDDWFNILTIHQNRAAHDPKAMVPESMFDDSVHLVVWGHEHEQLIVPQPVAGKRYRISQPGSSVATSLCPGEAAEKQVAIIHVEKRDYMVEPIVLKTVRPFIMDDIDLDDELEAANLTIDDKLAVGKLLKTKIQELIGRIDEEWEIKHADTPTERRPEKMLPLIRLRVQYTRHEMGNLVRFGQDFVGKVANPKDLLQFAKKKTIAKKKDKSQKGEEYVEPTEDMVPSERLERVKMSDLVQDYLGSQRLQILNPQGLERSIMNFVDKDDREAISHFVDKVLKSTRKGLVEIGPNEGQLDSELDKIREEQQRASRLAQGNRGDEDEDGAAKGSASKSGKNGKSTLTPGGGVDSDDSMLDDAMLEDEIDLSNDDNDDEENERSSRRTAASDPRSGGKTRGTQAARAKGRAGSTATRKQTFLGDNDDDEEAEEEEAPGHGKSSRTAALSSNRAAASKKRAPAKSSAAASRKTAPLPAKASTTKGRAAARNARGKLVESQAEDDDEEAGDEERDELQTYVISDDDDDDSNDFEVPATRQTQTQTRKRPIGRNQF